MPDCPTTPSLSPGLRVGVWGAGAFGTSVAKLLADNGAHVSIWAHGKVTCQLINNERENKRHLPGIHLPPSIVATTNLQEPARKADALIIAVPSLFLKETMQKLATSPSLQQTKSPPPLAILTKGFLTTPEGRPQLITEGLKSILPENYGDNLVYLSGPSHAEELAQGKITGFISASLSPRCALFFRNLLDSKRVKVFPSLDINGVQTCAASKNVMAIAFGIMEAFRQETEIVGDNTESLLLAASLNEIRTLGVALGATHPAETFSSIAGVGDLDVTCRSVLGRNRRLGMDIVRCNILQRFEGIDDLIERIQELGYLPEGVMAAKYISLITAQKNLLLPISRAVFQILNKEKSPYETINLVLRQPSPRRSSGP